MSANPTFFAQPRKMYTSNPHFEAVFAQAQAAGYISVQLPTDDLLIQRWSAWCSVHQMPIVQVCERRDTAWVSVDVVFCRTLLGKERLTELREIWQRQMPQPHALHGLTPVYCHFAGLDVRRAHGFALEIVRLLGTAA
jgi:hypothetical protein